MRKTNLILFFVFFLLVLGVYAGENSYSWVRPADQTLITQIINNVTGADFEDLFINQSTNDMATGDYYYTNTIQFDNVFMLNGSDPGGLTMLRVGKINDTLPKSINAVGYLYREEDVNNWLIWAGGGASQTQFRSGTNDFILRNEGSSGDFVLINEVGTKVFIADRTTANMTLNDSIILKCIEFEDGSIQCTRALTETEINNTIDARTASTTYKPYNVSVPTGTIDEGNLSSILNIEDSLTLNISEVGGSPGFDVRINFTNVTDFNIVTFRYNYDGSVSHIVNVDLWNYLTNDWETNFVIESASHFVLSEFNVFDPQSHINNTNVQMRITHTSSGNPSHDFYLDYIVLIDGFTTTTNQDHDGLTGRDDVDNHPQYLDLTTTRKTNGSFIHEGNFTIQDLQGNQVAKFFTKDGQVQLGDYDGLNSGMIFDLDPVNEEFSIETYTHIPMSFDLQAGEYYWGDYGAGQNNNYMGVDDDANLTFLESWKVEMRRAGDKYFRLDHTTQEYEFGDLDKDNYGNRILINDSANRTEIFAGDVEIHSRSIVMDDEDDNWYFIADIERNLFELGDQNHVKDGIVISIDDDDVYMSQEYVNYTFHTNYYGNTYKWGDIDNRHNGGYIFINDDKNLTTVHNTTLQATAYSQAGVLTINTSGHIYVNTSGVGGLSVMNDTMFLNRTTNDFIDGTMYIDKDAGKVSIGKSTAPSYELDVNGDTKITGSLGLGDGSPDANTVFNNAKTFTSGSGLFRSAYNFIEVRSLNVTSVVAQAGLVVLEEQGKIVGGNAQALSYNVYQRSNFNAGQVFGGTIRVFNEDGNGNITNGKVLNLVLGSNNRTIVSGVGVDLTIQNSTEGSITTAIGYNVLCNGATTCTGIKSNVRDDINSKSAEFLGDYVHVGNSGTPTHKTDGDLFAEGTIEFEGSLLHTATTTQNRSMFWINPLDCEAYGDTTIRDFNGGGTRGQYITANGTGAKYFECGIDETKRYGGNMKIRTIEIIVSMNGNSDYLNEHYIYYINSTSHFNIVHSVTTNYGNGVSGYQKYVLYNGSGITLNQNYPYSFEAIGNSNVDAGFKIVSVGFSYDTI